MPDQISPLAVAWLVASTVCFALAGVHVVAWFHRRRDLGNLFFALAALGAGGNALSELAMSDATSVEEFVFAMRPAEATAPEFPVGFQVCRDV